MKMKLSLLFILVFSSQSLAYLQEKIASIDTEADPEYLTLTMDPGNETHFGSRSITLLKKVSQVSVTILAFSRSRLMMNMTRVVCNGKKSIKVAGFVKEMFSIGFDKKNFIELKCPIEEGTIMIPELRKNIKLPILIPSFLAAEGNGEVRTNVTILVKGQRKIILQSFVKFHIENVKE